MALLRTIVIVGGGRIFAPVGGLRAVSLPGGHHFGGDYDRVAALILEHLR